MTIAAEKTCLNPRCGKKFTPGHYGDKQKVCLGSYLEDCRRCRGKDCPRCHGKGRYRQTCKAWYKGYWSKTRRPPRGVPADVFERIRKNVKDPIFRALIVVVHESGLRKGEALGLTWGDVVDPAGEIRKSMPILRQWEDASAGMKVSKTDARTGYFPLAAREALEAIRPKKVDPGARVFPFWESWVYDEFVGLQRRLKIANPATGEPYRFHDLRHSVGHDLVRAGRANLAQKLLGHKNIQTTMGYGELSDDEVLDDVEKTRKKPHN